MRIQVKNVNPIKITRVKLLKKNGGTCKFSVKDDLKGNFKDIMKKYHLLRLREIKHLKIIMDINFVIQFLH